MFYRGTELAQGTGLGLYIVKNGIDKLSGSIKITSQLNTGTKIFISIPNMNHDSTYTSANESLTFDKKE